MSNYVMQVDFFGNTVRCETNSHLISLNDLLAAGNEWRRLHGLPAKRLVDIVGTQAFEAFQAEVCKHLNKQVSDIYVTVKGRHGRTMGHLYLAIYVAEQMSPAFHVKVIQTFVEGKLLEFRDYGGTEFKTVNAAIDMYLPDREGRTNVGCYIQTAKLLREKILGPEAKAGDWDKATLAQTHARYEAERRLAEFLRMGFVRDWDHLKEIIEKL